MFALIASSLLGHLAGQFAIRPLQCLRLLAQCLAYTHSPVWQFAAARSLLGSNNASALFKRRSSSMDCWPPSMALFGGRVRCSSLMALFGGWVPRVAACNILPWWFCLLAVYNVLPQLPLIALLVGCSLIDRWLSSMVLLDVLPWWLYSVAAYDVPPQLLSIILLGGCSSIDCFRWTCPHRFCLLSSNYQSLSWPMALLSGCFSINRW